MKTFWKLNGLSALFSLFPFIGIEMYLNVYRLSRLTGRTVEQVELWAEYGFILGSVLFSILFIWLTNRIGKGRLVSFFSVVMWVPYFVLFVYILATWYPMTDPADDPGPAAGLVAMGGLIAYPFYLAVIVALSLAIGRLQGKSAK
ncbi:hypothetical protein [Paenibacillus soyae]|uniref:Uncharacterized protein n=1 Tax=Paenibacillus soyae TaxID=2969249 RepID=A0A9X2MSS0_9BACL|nr:hypothetical protein [Paenibacillus soyae]MCR2805562.1 hypothetical protein [Paenibacillus soyae]